MCSCVLNFSRKRFVSVTALLLAGVIVICTALIQKNTRAADKDFIKWVDFKVTEAAMEDALKIDIATYGSDIHISWIELLAIAACANGGDFSKYKPSLCTSAAKRMQAGETAEQIASSKYYGYFFDAYSAALGGFVGEYEKGTADENGNVTFEKCYGIKAFSPIAKGYPYSHYDDFGSSRSYGFRRTHLGNDLLGQVGTPIIAVESGIVEIMGWNQYGGWRIGIRSFDKKRYYYFAHLRKGYPYKLGLKEGDTVTAGDVIGYMGRTGYSTTEDTNNIKISHLHFGMELIFDESQKECDNEIWIDVYEIINFLEGHRSPVAKINAETKDYMRTDIYNDPAIPSNP